MARVTRKEWYRRVNGAWPEIVPRLTGEEAVRAGKKLYRFVTGRTWRNPVVVTSGNRYTWIRGGVMYVNPEKGWCDLVHLLSHYLAERHLGVDRPHGGDHARVELRMIKEVVRRGWLQGSLKSKPKPAVVRDVRADRKASIEARIARWESKRKRAERALQKLRRSLRYYERQLTQPQQVAA